MTFKTLKVLILGAGFMGSVHAEGYKQLPGVEIVGFIDRNAEKARSLATQYGVDSRTELDDNILARADFVDICLPTWLHKPMALKAFSAGKDVLCEKPISIDPADAEEMIKASELSGRKLMIAHVVRFWPEYNKLKEMLTTREIINPMQVTFSRFGPTPEWSEENWMLRDDKSGGIIFDLAIHDMDFCIWAFGMPKWVFARKNLIGGNYTAYINAILGYEGLNVLIESGFIYKKGYPFTTGFRIAAEDATYEYVNKTHTGLMKYIPDGKSQRIDYPDWNPYHKEVEYFVNCIRNNRKPDICTGNEALNAIKLAGFINKSAQEEKKVEVM